jgi:hypothetical protein
MPRLDALGTELARGRRQRRLVADATADDDAKHAEPAEPDTTDTEPDTTDTHTETDNEEN